MPASVDRADRRRTLRAALEAASHLLPAQAPLETFIHHNTLHAFEHLPFTEGVELAAARFGCRPYLTEEFYRDQIGIGRIRWEDVDAVLEEEPEAARPYAAPDFPERPRDILLRATGRDADVLVHELLVPFCAAFCDQGLAHWPLPGREAGFWAAFIRLHGRGFSLDPWCRRVGRELARLAARGAAPEDVLLETLDALGAAPDTWRDSLEAALLALRGWAGMLRRLEGAAVDVPAPEGTLTAFAAVRLLLDRLAAQQVAEEELGWTGALPDLLVRHAAPPPVPPARSIERRRALQLAYDRRFVLSALDALTLHRVRRKERPRFQALFCIDEREESLRRHLEETAPVETFGIAGFFFVPMLFRGAAEARHRALCPVVITPRRRVSEVHARLERRRDRIRRLARRGAGWLGHYADVAGRALASGAVFSSVAGALAAAPLAMRVLFPRAAGLLRKRLSRAIFSSPQTRLSLEEFTLAERVESAERVLRDSGLTKDFCRLVVAVGHGSSSLNNPHASAYNCGACGGARGGPNARAVAQILNEPAVRRELSERGLAIPGDTFFLGALHDTAADQIAFFDLDLVPAGHRAELEELRASLEEALSRNAAERCRRFDSAPARPTPGEARIHVEGRAHDLAQVRPELGHATNALCVIGRRERTKGLFLDRRAFLNSYDPGSDDAEGTILERILRAAVPVCAGISLEYFFSRIDNVGYGCGTKLPHNVAGLVGVMDGAMGDLRTGLPWQMVELHEPVRILFVLEAPRERVEAVLSRLPEIERLVRNGWIRLALLAPEAPRVYLWRRGDFVEHRPMDERLPSAPDSLSWAAGRKGCLSFARIGL